MLSILVWLDVEPYVPEPIPPVAIFKVTLPDVPPPVKLVPAFTAVISPTLDVNPASLLNMLNPISLAAFLRSAPESNTINSSVPTIVAVISISSDKSKVIVPEVENEPSKPVPVETWVTVPCGLLNDVCNVTPPCKPIERVIVELPESLKLFTELA